VNRKECKPSGKKFPERHDSEARCYVDLQARLYRCRIASCLRVPSKLKCCYTSISVTIMTKNTGGSALTAGWPLAASDSHGRELEGRGRYIHEYSENIQLNRFLQGDRKWVGKEEREGAVMRKQEQIPAHISTVATEASESFSWLQL
jgi:hypothetical protein